MYTHKLDLEWDTAFHVFKQLPERNWLRNVEIEVSLDYLARDCRKRGIVSATSDLSTARARGPCRL